MAQKRLEYRKLAKLGVEFLDKGRGSDGANDDLLFFSLSRDGAFLYRFIPFLCWFMLFSCYQ